MDEKEFVLEASKSLSNHQPNRERDSIECEHPVIFEQLAVSDEQKIKKIEVHFAQILEIIGLDLENDSITKTPHRFAKMVVKELFKGLKEENFPKITTQENSFDYHEMLLESNISIYSICEHHFMPIVGYCHIAYIPKDKVIGLSKLNRIAQYYAKRPQVQERMTRQIQTKLIELVETEDVAVVVDALHLCVRMRGIQDSQALTRTLGFSGCFRKAEYKRQVLDSIPPLHNINP